MKKTIIMMLGVATLASLNSCFKTEDDLFDQSTAQRLEAANKANEDALTGAENGWVIEYFANEYEQAYPILAKFDTHGGVTIAANNSVTTGGVYKEASSTYSLSSDTGPVLSFDTWNDVFSGFADPSDDGLGHEGDYEFIVTKISAAKDTIYLTGKKHGLKMRMVKFPMGAEYTAADGTTAKIEKWEDYYTAQAAVKSRLFNSKVTTVYMTVGEHKYDVSGMNSGVFNFIPSGGDDSQAISKPYYLGLDGSISLLTPYTGVSGEISVQHFRLADDGTLVGDENSVIRGASIYESFTNLSNNWRINKETLSDGLATLYNTIVTRSKEEYRQTFNFFQFDYDSSAERFALSFKDGRYTGYFYINIEQVGDNKIKITYTGEYSQAAGVHAAAIPEYLDFVNKVANSTYTITENNPLAATVLTAVNDADSSVKFEIILQ